MKILASWNFWLVENFGELKILTSSKFWRVKIFGELKIFVSWNFLANWKFWRVENIGELKFMASWKFWRVEIFGELKILVSWKFYRVETFGEFKNWGPKYVMLDKNQVRRPAAQKMYAALEPELDTFSAAQWAERLFWVEIFKKSTLTKLKTDYIFWK